LGGRDPQDFGQGVVGFAGGRKGVAEGRGRSWTGRELLLGLYFNMYRKCVRMSDF